jgi:hypothetical protein
VVIIINNIVIIVIYSIVSIDSMKVGPCHHGMVRPRAVESGLASDMEGSCE